MIDGIEAVTTATLGRALDVASLRQQTFAANIANANVEGYRPLRVRFESELGAARNSLATRGMIDPTLLDEMKPSMELQLDALGRPTDVHLDAEVAGLAQNAVTYQAVLAGLTRHYGLLSYAVSDGKK